MTNPVLDTYLMVGLEALPIATPLEWRTLGVRSAKYTWYFMFPLDEDQRHAALKKTLHY